MAPRIAPPSRNAAAQALLELYQSTERRIIQEIARKRTQGYVDYAELAALRRVRKTIQQMVDKSAKYVPLAIEHEFYKGKEAKKGYENALGMTEGAAERDRVAEQLVDNLMGEVQEMAQTAYQSAEAQILGPTAPDFYRQSVLRGAIVSETMGRGSLSTVEEVMQSLQQAGITAFVDKAGREWSLSAYGAMAVRTTVRQAQVSAVLTADDHDLWKIKEIGSTCPLCAVYEGRVYSKSGMNPNYPPLAAAFGKMDPAGPNDLSNTFLNIHPGCLHSLVRWTEDYKTDEEIRQAREFSSFETNPKTNDPRTEKQIEAYRNKERQRAAYRRDLDQFERYTRAGVEGFPRSMATFLKHKQADDEKYKAWMAEYRKVEKPQKPEKPKTPEPKKFVSSFRPAANIAEAEEYARRYTDPNGFGALGVSFKGVSLDVANAVNKTIGDFYDEFDVGKFGGVTAPAGNTKLGKMMSGATAGYIPIRNSFVLNRQSLKDLKTATAALAKEQEVVTAFLAHPEDYDLSRASRRVREVLEASKVSGRGTVPTTIEEAISHELGHALEKKLRSVPNYAAIQANMAAYAPKISGYATESLSEYIAESFASYRRGESLADPELIKAFEALKRK